MLNKFLMSLKVAFGIMIHNSNRKPTVGTAASDGRSQMTVDVLLLCAPLLSVFLPLLLLLLFERLVKSVMEEMAEQKESGGRSRDENRKVAERMGRWRSAVAMIKD